MYGLGSSSEDAEELSKAFTSGGFQPHTIYMYFCVRELRYPVVQEISSAHFSLGRSYLSIREGASPGEVKSATAVMT